MHTECKLYLPLTERKAQTRFSRQGGNPTYPGAMFPVGTPTAKTAKLSDAIALLTVHLSVTGHIQGCVAPTRISLREFVFSDPKALALLRIVRAG